MTSPFKISSDVLMDKNELANTCKTLRNLNKLTQQKVADKVTESRTAAGLEDDAAKVSKQSIYLAERKDRPGYDSLRIEIIELLSGRELEGPYWKFKEEATEESGGE